MSATIDSTMFSNYFTTAEGPAPVVDISGKFYEVTEVYLDSIMRFGFSESVKQQCVTCRFSNSDNSIHLLMWMMPNFIQRWSSWLQTL